MADKILRPKSIPVLLVIRDIKCITVKLFSW